jgi:hypothetical protein
MTPLDKTLKRALKINGRDYAITLSPEALKITRKGHRLGVVLKWLELVSGESALAVALHASVGKFHDDPLPAARMPKDQPRARAKTKVTASIARRTSGKPSVRKRPR